MQYFCLYIIVKFLVKQNKIFFCKEIFGAVGHINNSYIYVQGPGNQGGRGRGPLELRFL